MSNLNKESDTYEEVQLYSTHDAGFGRYLHDLRGAALTAQAAGPRDYPQRWEQHDDRDYRHDDRNWEKERKDWEKNHKTSTQKDVDKANRKANIAIGVAAVATIIALTK